MIKATHIERGGEAEYTETAWATFKGNFYTYNGQKYDYYGWVELSQKTPQQFVQGLVEKKKEMEVEKVKVKSYDPEIIDLIEKSIFENDTNELSIEKLYDFIEAKNISIKEYKLLPKSKLIQSIKNTWKK